MKKTTNILSVINFILLAFMFFLLGVYYMEVRTIGDAWTHIGLYIISLVFILLSLGLSIPGIYFIVKLGFKNIRLYALSHLLLVLLSVIMLWISLVSLFG